MQELQDTDDDEEIQKFQDTDDDERQELQDKDIDEIIKIEDFEGYIAKGSGIQNALSSFETSFQDALNGLETSPKENISFDCTKCGFSGTSEESYKEHISFFHLSGEIETERPQNFKVLGDTRTRAFEDTFSDDEESSEKNASNNFSKCDLSEINTASMEKQSKVSNQSDEKLINLKGIANKKTIEEDLLIGCTGCNFVTENLEDYCHHSRSIHSLMLEATKLRCRCTVCNLYLTNIYGLKRHNLTKHALKNFHCKLCTYETTRKDSLRGHIMLKHENRGAYNCQHCKFRCMRPGNFETHMYRNHRGNK